jgi:acyl-homoserine lactone acylase PvdQ
VRQLKSTVAIAASIVASLAVPNMATAGVDPYGAGETGTFFNILPPGTHGTTNAEQFAAFQANSSNRPPHNVDQLGMYHALTQAAPNIEAAQIPDYFKDATFGVKPGDVESSVTPEPGATIIRDKGFGVPHIYGDTRAELEFGIGYATAEDRLFMIDVLRHAGAGDLASFAGGSNVGMDEGVWRDAPYTQADLNAQLNYISTIPGGPQVIQDGQNYVDGINAYIAQAKVDPLLMPVEYAAIGQPLGPQPFTITDIISIASLIGGELGQGGGDQLPKALLYEQLLKRFGAERHAVAGYPGLPPRHPQSARVPDHSAFATLTSFTQPDDPEAPTTVQRGRFPYQTLPKPTAAVARTVALPDPGSVHYVSPVVASSGSAASADNRRPTQGLLGAFPTSDSNALLVSGRNSANGRPIAVIGPQVAYWSPEILMEQDIHGPGIQADGASFPGTNVYVELGHGQNYAWSATSEGQNIIDTFAVPLCNPAGGAVAADSDYYRLGHSCVAMQAITETESWKSNLADSTPAGSVTLKTLRTAYGLVIARARVHGRPIVYTNDRSTYMHELDSATGFEAFNDPAQMQTPQQFMHNADQIGYTFNWFFINPHHIAYQASGANPVRARHTDPIFPSWSRYAWSGLRPGAAVTPETTTVRVTPEQAHPHVLDQGFITSWNNKPAHGYDYVDGQYSSIYRSQLLDQNIEHYLKTTHHKLTLVDLINAMGNAGTQDLRGVEVLPYALGVLGRPGNPVLRQAVATLRAWVATGAHRINRQHPGASGSYEQTDAIRIMDAWWPLLVKADLGSTLGPGALSEVESNFSIDNQPSTHQGSAWDTGFYGIVQKDLRRVLRERVRGPLNRIYCGGGSLARCRTALGASLLKAATMTAEQVYPAGGGCSAGDQMCRDDVRYKAIGAITVPPQEWVNRPTFQQAIEFPSG